MILALLLAMVLAEALFLLSPPLDIGPSGWFFDPARDFWLAENTALDRLRATFRLSIFLVGLPALLLLLLSVLRPAQSSCGPRSFAFALLGTLLGPGLLVNRLLLSYSFERL